MGGVALGFPLMKKSPFVTVSGNVATGGVELPLAVAVIVTAKALSNKLLPPK